MWELQEWFQWRPLGETLTLSVPGCHGNDPVDSCLSHGADHCVHGQGVSRHAREDRGREAETGYDHVLPLKMSLQTACGENVRFHHLETAGNISQNDDSFISGLTLILSFSLLLSWECNGLYLFLINGHFQFNSPFTLGLFWYMCLCLHAELFSSTPYFCLSKHLLGWNKSGIVHWHNVSRGCSILHSRKAHVELT